MKNTDKVTMTVGQLKRLVRESVSNEDEFVIENGVLKEYLGDSDNVVIPNGVVEIADRAFAGEEDIKSVTIPDSVTSIGEYAFYGLLRLKSVTIPIHLENISKLFDFPIYRIEILDAKRVKLISDLGAGLNWHRKYRF